MSFQIVPQSIFDTPADAFTNSINCSGAMGAGIALEFKNRYPKMFEDYKIKCQKKLIKPGDCYAYWDDENHIWLLGLAVKNDWKQWATEEWMEQCLKSMKLIILENDIKSVNMPLIGGQNGRRGPLGRIPGMTPPSTNKEEIKDLIKRNLSIFADKFEVEINLCIPELKVKKPTLDLTAFLEKI